MGVAIRVVGGEERGSLGWLPREVTAIGARKEYGEARVLPAGTGSRAEGRGGGEGSGGGGDVGRGGWMYSLV